MCFLYCSFKHYLNKCKEMRVIQLRNYGTVTTVLFAALKTCCRILMPSGARFYDQVSSGTSKIFVLIPLNYKKMKTNFT